MDSLIRRLSSRTVRLLDVTVRTRYESITRDNEDSIYFFKRKILFLVHTEKSDNCIYDYGYGLQEESIILSEKFGVSVVLREKTPGAALMID